MKFDSLWRRSAILAAVTAVVVTCGWVFGFDGGALFPVAIGAATAVAIFSEARSNCAPRFLRRRG